MCCLLGADRADPGEGHQEGGGAAVATELVLKVDLVGVRVRGRVRVRVRVRVRIGVRIGVRVRVSG